MHSGLSGMNFDTRLVIAGYKAVGSDEYIQELVQTATTLGLKESVTLLTDPTPEQLQQTYASASTFIFPSRIESFGLVLLEAMAASLPIVANRLTGAGEIVPDTAGLLVDATPVSYAGAAIALFDNRDKARMMGSAGRQMVLSQFSVDSLTPSTREANRGSRLRAADSRLDHESDGEAFRELAKQGRCPICAGPGTRLYESMGDQYGLAQGEWTLVTCPAQCGVAWLHPSPTDAELASAYSSYYYTHSGRRESKLRDLADAAIDGYLSTRLGYGTKSPVAQLLALLAHLLPSGTMAAANRAMYLTAPAGAATLLDVGCGSGDQLLRMRRLGWEVSGVDLDEIAVRVAQARGLTVNVGSLEDQQFPEASFDAITLHHVIEHLPNPFETLHEIGRILRPGGRVVIATPNLQSWGHRLFGGRWVSLDAPRHRYLFTAKSLEWLVRAAGLEPVMLRTSARCARGAWSMSHAQHADGKRLAFQVSPRRQLAGLPFEYAERFAISTMDRTLGEELVLLAQRP